MGREGDADAAAMNVFIAIVVLAVLTVAIWINSDRPTATYIPQSSSPRQETEQDKRDIARRQIEVTDFAWSKSSFGVMTLNRLTVANRSDYDLKDIEVRCLHSAPSGTDIDSNTRTIYEIIPARTTRTFRDFNMGFIHSQAARTGCTIRNAVVGSHRPAPPAKTTPGAAAKPTPAPKRSDVEKRWLSDNPK